MKTLKKHMKSLKENWKLLFVLILLSSCAKVKIKDGEWCGDAGPLGASCFHTLSDGKRDIPKETWDEIAVGPDHRFGKVCTDAENFANWKASILKLCKIAKGRCTYDLKKKVVKFSSNINEFVSLRDSIVFDLSEQRKQE